MSRPCLPWVPCLSALDARCPAAPPGAGERVSLQVLACETPSPCPASVFGRSCAVGGSAVGRVAELPQDVPQQPAEAPVHRPIHLAPRYPLTVGGRALLDRLDVAEISGSAVELGTKRLPPGHKLDLTLWQPPTQAAPKLN